MTCRKQFTVSQWKYYNPMIVAPERTIVGAIPDIPMPEQTRRAWRLSNVDSQNDKGSVHL